MEVERSGSGREILGADVVEYHVIRASTEKPFAQIKPKFLKGLGRITPDFLMSF